MGARLITIVGASLLLGAACGDGGNEASDATRPPTESSRTTPAAPPTESAASTTPEDDPRPDPVIAWLDGVDQNWDALWPAAEVFIEHDCVMLKSPDETNVLTLSVWPTGTTWDQEAAAIVLPDGFVVQEGDVIEIGGGVVPFIEDADNLSAAALGDDGLARLKACSANHPNVEVWLLDAEGRVGPGSVGETNMSTAVTIPSGERPPAATAAELTERLEQLDFPELEQPIEAGQDWNGVLVGWIFTRLADDETWYLCKSIDESLPPACGTGVQLVARPSIVTEHPEEFETINDDTGVPSVVMSVSLVSLAGTFLHDSALFLATE